MADDISLVGLATNDPVPGNYIEVDFAAGPPAGFSGVYAALLIGGMLQAANTFPADPAGLKAATATSASPVTLMASDLISNGKTALLDYPRAITLTSAGTTAHVPATATITGTDIDGNSISEVMVPATSAATVTSTKIYRTLVSIAYASAGGTDATIAIGFTASTFIASGTATPDTVLYGPDTTVSMTQESDVIGLFGYGSELHRMWRRFTAINQTTPLYAIAVSEGSSPQSSTGTVTITGTATGSGTVRTWVGDSFCDAGFATGDTPTVIAGNVVTALNAMPATPVFATEAGGVITLVTLQRGLRANFVRYLSQVLPTTSGVSVSPTASTTTSGGSVSDSNATALTTIATTRFYYIASAAEDATQVGALLAQVNNQALPVTGIRQSVCAGSADTLGNTIAITTSVNTARAEVAWLAQSDMPPCELAANHAAVIALEESGSQPLLNFNNFGNDANTQSLWLVKAPLSGAKPTRPQIASALNSGVTPIAVGRGGVTYLVKRVTTRFLNGSIVDYRIRPPHKRLIADRYADDLVTKQALQFQGKTIANDPVANEPIPGATTVTPRVMLATVNRLTDDYNENGFLQNVSQIKAGTTSVRKTNPTTSIATKVPLQVVDLLDRTETLVLQVA